MRRRRACGVTEGWAEPAQRSGGQRPAVRSEAEAGGRGGRAAGRSEAEAGDRGAGWRSAARRRPTAGQRSAARRRPAAGRLGGGPQRGEGRRPRRRGSRPRRGGGRRMRDERRPTAAAGRGERRAGVVFASRRCSSPCLLVWLLCSSLPPPVEVRRRPEVG
ncbi:Os01g0140001 [Oryza sativa Japonica Group]|uniref:Os01g0140001 protein n=1 Tax=Oryza sativa subsp. japonica TaxID=39947 RepID=A0A0P0UXX7_ORYSJ|nr:Os01g0140001 [Oryza sativa Japonica Group]